MSKPDLAIEQLTRFSQEDAEAIRRLAQKLGSNFKPLDDNEFKNMLKSPTTFLFVARSSGNQAIIGMITLVIYRIPYVKKAHLDDLIVDESHRGEGLGSQLLEKALSFAEESGASYVDFTSRPERVEGNKLYEKFGFKKRDTNVYRLNYDYAKAK